MKKIILISILILYGLITPTLSCRYNRAVSDLSVLILKVKYASHGLTGFGGELLVRNSVTNEKFVSHSKRGMNPYIIIENIPEGTYIVEELKIISGPNILTISDVSKYNPIVIGGPKIYYLGNYKAMKIPPLLELHFQVNRKENDIERKIFKEMKKYSEKWLNLKIDFDQNIFKSEKTEIHL